jgi:OmpA-OmpF porin, OOP family
MYIRVFLAALVATIAAGCSSSSGPTHNTDVVMLSTGEQVWRVQCQGLLSSANTCMDRAKEICQDKAVSLVGLIDPMASDRNGVKNPREITFRCGNPPAAAPAPAPAPVPAPAPAPQKIKALTLNGDANFATNSATLSPVAQRKLDEFIQANQGYRIERLVISGHTDSTGSEVLNQRLSAARARSAQEYLTAHGLRASSYDVRGYASSMPVASNATAEGRLKNRRIEIQTEGVEIRAIGQ